MANEDNYIDKYVKKIGYIREKLSNKEILPLQKIRIYVLFGDIDSIIMFSKSVYNNTIRDENFYDIIISWQGFSSIFSKADEFWSLSDDKIITQLFDKTDGLQNTSNSLFSLVRSLNENFINVYTAHDFEDKYKYYLTDEYKGKNTHLDLDHNKLLPLSYLSQNFVQFVTQENSMKLVAFIPFKFCYVWEDYKKQPKPIEENSFITILEGLSKTLRVVVLQNEFTVDLSRKFISDKVTYIKESNMQKVISMINHCKNYFDFFANSFSIGFLAQAFTFALIDKPSWFEFKKYQDYEFLTHKHMYKNYGSFNYFTNFDSEINLNFLSRLTREAMLFYYKQKTEAIKAIEPIKQFETKNFSTRKLHYLGTNKVFFLRNQKDA